MSDAGDDAQPWQRELVEASPVPVAVYTGDGILQYVNDAVVDFVNATSQDEVVGRPAAEFVHPDDREFIGERVRKIVERRESVEPAEARFLAVDGEVKHATVAGAPVTYEGMVAGQAILNDVTERRRREQELREERDRLELLFENLPSAAVHGTAEDGEPIVERVNSRFEEVFGYDREEIVGENLDEYIVPDDRTSLADEVNERILSEGRVRTEVERETADGKRELLLNIAMKDLDDDTPEGYAIYTDITEQKRARRELERQNERLEKFAKIVSHDLRNPLEVARANVELARTECDSDRLDEVESAHGRMEDLIEELLTLSGQGGRATETAPAAIASAVESSWNNVETGAATLRVEATGTVECDYGLLQQLLENLFRNAIEHCGEDVTVTVGDLDDGFYVADDGPGIPEAERDRVFDLGYSTSDGGTGYGLNIVKQVADAHDWDVDVTESRDGGARFEVTGVDGPDRD